MCVVGLVVVLVAFVVHPDGTQEVAGSGLAVLMTGMMVVLLGNYLRHASEQEPGRTGRRGRAISDSGPGPFTTRDGGPFPTLDADAGTSGGGQPSSVPTTDTNDTISPG